MVEDVSWKSAEDLVLISHPDTPCRQLEVDGRPLVSEGVYHDFPEGEDSFFDRSREEKKERLEELGFFTHQGSGRTSDDSVIESFLTLVQEGTPAVLRLADWSPGEEEYSFSSVLFDGEYFYYIQYDKNEKSWGLPLHPYANVFSLKGQLPNARMSDHYLVLTDYADLDFLTYAYAAGPLWDEEICSNTLCVLHIQY